MATFRSNQCALLACVIIGAFLVGQTNAHAHAAAPPRYWVDTALKIGACEQPSGRVGKWAGVWWKNEKNYSFLGGMGMTLLNWENFKRPGQPERMSDATPIEQIWAAWRLYQWAEKTYPGYGWTAWDCDKTIGFRGFNRSNQWK